MKSLAAARLWRNVGLGLAGILRLTGDHLGAEGSWSGNDTVWRMCLDLNKIVSYGNSDGSLRKPGSHARKRHYVLLDGILAGEGSGPLNPDPIAAGVLMFGIHPPSVDAACAYLMGFDPDKIPIVSRAFQCREYPLSNHRWREIVVRSNHGDWHRSLVDINDEATLHFKPHFGWRGHIERTADLGIPADQSIGAGRQP